MAYPNTILFFSITYILPIITNINNYIKDDYKKFTCLKELKHIKNSMRYLCDSLNRTYFLIETAGQNNIQKLEVRVNQQLFIINSILNNL